MEWLLEWGPVVRLLLNLCYLFLTMMRPVPWCISKVRALGAVRGTSSPSDIS